MRLFKPRLSDHRHARLVAWALAMLLWMAGVLRGAGVTSRHLRQRGGAPLHAAAHFVKQLIVVRAQRIARLRTAGRFQYWRYGRLVLRRGVFRAIVGARVRKALRRRDPFAQLAALIDALAHVDSFARMVAARIRRRLTRLWPKRAARADDALAAPCCAPEAAFADSS